MKTNAAGIALIKAAESLRLTAYLCPRGIPTIGYGHTGDVTHDDVKNGRTITEHQAEAILGLDLDTAERDVEELTRGVKLNENQFSALVSFVFNFGRAKFKGSTLRSKVVQGDFAGAAAEFRFWNHAVNPKTGKLEVLPGLTKRRADERALFETPPAAPAAPKE